MTTRFILRTSASEETNPIDMADLPAVLRQEGCVPRDMTLNQFAFMLDILLGEGRYVGICDYDGNATYVLEVVE